MKITDQVTRVIDYFRRPQNTAQLAKQRLQIIIAHERGERDKPDYFVSMQQDLLAVIAKYVSINKDDIKMDVQRKDGCSILELNITLPA
jgi:cell division topological specificity factor